MISYLDENDYMSILTVSNVGEFDIANLLGINLRCIDDHALVSACRNGHLPVVKYLIEKCGADISTSFS